MSKIEKLFFELINDFLHPETNDDEYIPTESEEKLQTELQTYALDLLENNLSWEKRKVIQNLVIWEPVTDPALLAVPYVPGKYKICFKIHISCVCVCSFFVNLKAGL